MADKALVVPFAEEVLAITNPITKEKVRVIVSQRVDVFREVVKGEQKRLRDAWKWWGECVEGIQDSLIGAPGVGDGSTGKGYAEKYARIEKEYQKKRKAILERFEQESDALVKGVEEGEKVRRLLVWCVMAVLTMIAEVQRPTQATEAAIHGVHEGADGGRCGGLGGLAKCARIVVLSPTQEKHIYEELCFETSRMSQRKGLLHGRIRLLHD